MGLKSQGGARDWDLSPGRQAGTGRTWDSSPDHENERPTPLLSFQPRARHQPRHHAMVPVLHCWRPITGPCLAAGSTSALTAPQEAARPGRNGSLWELQDSRELRACWALPAAQSEDVDGQKTALHLRRSRRYSSASLASASESAISTALLLLQCSTDGHAAGILGMRFPSPEDNAGSARCELQASVARSRGSWRLRALRR